MGRLYTGSDTVLNPENTLATYENGTVYTPPAAMGMGHEILMYYDEGEIYRKESDLYGKSLLARCDKFGKIENTSGKKLGYCENGMIKDSSGRIIAYYEGNLYGAAAAAYAVFFKASGSDDNSKSSDKETESNSASSASTRGVDLLFSVLGGILSFGFRLVWKLLKTLPIWWPLGAIVISTMIMTPTVQKPSLDMPGIPVPTTPSTTNSSQGALIISALFFLLHVVLCFMCRKKTTKIKYWPLYVEFVLYLLTFRVLYGLPVVLFQIGWLVWDIKHKSK